MVSVVRSALFSHVYADLDLHRPVLFPVQLLFWDSVALNPLKLASTSRQHGSLKSSKYRYGCRPSRPFNGFAILANPLTYLRRYDIILSNLCQILGKMAHWSRPGVGASTSFHFRASNASWHSGIHSALFSHVNADLDLHGQVLFSVQLLFETVWLWIL